MYAVGGTTVITDGTDYLDSVNRPLVSNTRMLASGSYSRNEKRYDSLGRTAQVMMPCTWTALTTACPYATTNSYDVLNRLLTSTRPISSTNNSPQSTSYAYAGRTTRVTDALTNTRTLVSDVNGWLRQTTDPKGYTVTLAYDAAGNKTAVTDSLSNRLWSGTYAYGISAFLNSVTDMDMGTWAFTPDALGEITSWKDAKLQPFSETYDALSRPLIRTEPDLYTSWTWGSTPSAHNVGKLASVCTGTGTNPANCTATPGYSEAETYDSDGRLSTRAITIPTQGTFTFTSQYDSTTGLLSALIYPTIRSYPLQLQYAYQNGLLQSITDVSNMPTFTAWTANAIDPAGHVTQETLGNGIVTTRNYDAVTGWVGSIQAGTGGGSATQNQGFLYDEMGNVTQRQDNNLGLTENAWYDNDYRLSYTKLNGAQNLSLSYDGTGNITSRSDVAGGATWTYDPTHKHEVTQAGNSSFQYSYDANGNAVTRQGSSIGWTSYNYPSAINAGSGSTAESVAFSYGPDRARWQQNYNGNSTQETTYYIGGLIDLVVSGSSIDTRYYINVGGRPVAVHHFNNAGSQAIDYIFADHQGSVAALTRGYDTQTVVSESYTPYGNRRNSATWSGAELNANLTTSAGITRQGYTFQTQLGLWMGMNHMNGRVQDAITGRFLSADPTIPDLTNTQSYNRYSYVNNNPLTFIDPTGFNADCLDPGDITCASSGGQMDEIVVHGTTPPPLLPDPTLIQFPGELANLPLTLPRFDAGGGNGQKTKPQGTPRSKACQLAASLAAPSNSTNQALDKIGNGLATQDAALQSLTSLAPSLPLDLRAGGVALGQLAASASKVVGPAGYLAGGVQVGYNAYQGVSTGNTGYYTDAAFGAADLGIEATLATLGGPVGVGVALAWGYAGGSKAVTSAGAIAACSLGF